MSTFQNCVSLRVGGERGKTWAFALVLALVLLPGSPAFSETAEEDYSQALALAKSGDVAKAAPFFIRAADLAASGSAPQISIVVMSCYFGGLYDLQAGRTEEGVSFLQRLLGYADRLKSEDAMNVRFNLAKGLVQLGRVDEATASFEETAKLARAAGQLGVVASIYASEGDAFDSAERLPEAERAFTSALAAARDAGSAKDRCSLGLKLGDLYRRMGRLDEAESTLRDALAQAASLGDRNLEAIGRNDIGLVQAERRNWSEAIASLRSALDISRGNGDSSARFYAETLFSLYAMRGDIGGASKVYDESKSRDEIAADLDGLFIQAGDKAKEKGELQTALACFEAALASAKKGGGRSEQAQSRLADIRTGLGDYEGAVRAADALAASARERGDDSSLAVALSLRGISEKHWGRYDQAIADYERALEIDRRLGNEGKISVRLNNLAAAYAAKGEGEKARGLMDEALARMRRSESDANLAIGINNIAAIYQSMGLLDTALGYYREALEVDRRRGASDKVALRLQNIASLQIQAGQTAKSRDSLAEAEALFKAAGGKEGLGEALYLFGLSYYLEGDYARSAEYLERSASIVEELRLTAPPEVRRDYLARQIRCYQYLASCKARLKDPAGLFSAIERSRAKVLSETLAGKDSLPAAEASVLGSVLGDDQVLAIYANVEHDAFCVLGAAKGSLQGQEVSKAEFVGRILKDYGKRLGDPAVGSAGRRGLSVAAAPQTESVPARDLTLREDFRRIVEYYRAALSRPGFDKDPAAKAIGRGLYDLLVGPIAAIAKGKKELLVCADDVLGYLPFEALVDPAGRWAIESWAVRYVPSVGSLGILQGRKYPPGRQSFIGLGGAPYASSGEAPAPADPAAPAFARLVEDASARGLSMRPYYSRLGIVSWPELPGTRSEVRAIAAMTGGSKLVLGAEASESQVKALSDSGELAKYAAVHFAAHGIVVGPYPELSALVLAQGGDLKGQDGYLRAPEAARLRLSADFVALSACDTALGAMYAGEGVVGLTQAFLAAGARGVSVSLWSISDEATAKFMAELYRIAWSQKKGFAQATAEAKRRFISGALGPAYSDPFYWAPFAYFGI